MSGNSYKNARFAEFYTYGEGFKVNNGRIQLDPLSALTLLMTIGEDFTYMEESYPTMYLALADYTDVDAAIAEARKNFGAIENGRVQ